MGIINAKKRVLYTLYTVAFLDIFAVSLFLPFINREIKNLGGSAFIIGLATSAYGAIQIISSPIFGHGCDIYGRKSILCFTILVSAFSYVFLGFSSSLSMMFLSRILSAHTQTLSKVILTDISPEDKSFVLGQFNAFGSMGFIIGPSLGAHILETQNGFRNICFLTSLIFILNLILIQLIVPETHTSSDQNQNAKKAKTEEKGSSKNLFGYFSTSGVFTLLLLRFLFSFATIVPRSNLFLIFESKFSTSVISFGYLTTLQGAVATIAGFGVGPAISYFYKDDCRKLVIHTSIAQFISLILLTISPSYFLASLALILLNASNPFLRVGITSLSLNSKSEHGAILGLGQTSTSLSRMLAPLLSGISQEILGVDGPAAIGTFSAFLGIIIIVYSTNLKSSLKFSTKIPYTQIS